MNNTEIIFLVEDSNEGRYEAHALGHSIFTEADNVDELRNNIRDAVACHFEEDKRPNLIRVYDLRRSETLSFTITG